MTGHFYERLYVASDGICRDVPGSRRRLKSRVNEIQCNQAKMYFLFLLRLRLAFHATKIYPQESRSRRFHRDNIETQRTYMYIHICDLFRASLACTARIYCVIGLVGSAFVSTLRFLSLFLISRCLYYYNIIYRYYIPI